MLCHVVRICEDAKETVAFLVDSQAKQVSVCPLLECRKSSSEHSNAFLTRV